MSYASDHDDIEQCLQGEEQRSVTKQYCSFEEFCERYIGDISNLSGNDQAHARWSYKQYTQGK